MLILGAGGHAGEVFEVLVRNGNNSICFFDDYSTVNRKVLNQQKIYKSLNEVEELFHTDNRFCIGVGNVNLREKLAQRFKSFNGKLESVIANTSIIGSLDVIIGEGVNIMDFVFISNNVTIGEGSLLNTRVNIHHDVVIGKYCEVSPSATLLGGVKLGDKVTIGSGAVILPGIEIGDKAIVGAGAVVTKNVNRGDLVVGVPGKKKEKN